MKNLRVAMFPLSSFISHVTRCLCIADELTKRGHSVEFVCSDKNSRLIQDAGYEVHIVRQLEHDQIVVTGAPEEYLLRYQRESGHKCEHEAKLGLREMALDELSVLKGMKPDLVIMDSCPTAFMSATALDIPCLMIKNILGYFDSGLARLAKHLGIDYEDELDFSIEHKMTQEFSDDCFKLYNAFTTKEKHIPMLIPGIPEIETLNGINLYEKRYSRFVGNFEWNGWKNRSAPEIEKYQDKTVILVSMGSSFPFEGVIKNIVKAFSDEQFQIIINTGNQIHFPENQNGQSNYEIHPYLDLEAYLSRANVMICHGGHGSIMSALKAGVPTLSIPFNGDQMIISKQMETLGCGLRIKKYPDDISPDELKTCVERLLTEAHFSENAHHFGKMLMDFGNGAENAVDFVEEFYTGRTWDLHATREIKSVLSLRETTPVSDSRMLFMLENPFGFAFDYSLSMANELKKSGHQIGFLFSGEVQQTMKLTGFECFQTPILFNTLQLESMDSDQLETERRNRIAEDAIILENFKPTHIIDAGRIGARFVSSKHNSEYFQLYTGAINQVHSTVDPLFESSSLEFPAETESMLNEDHPMLFPGTPSLFQQVAPKQFIEKRIIYLGAPRGNELNPDFEFPTSLYLDKTVIVILLDQREEHQLLIKQLMEIVDPNTLFIQFTEGETNTTNSNETTDRLVFLNDDEALTAAMKLSNVVIHGGNFAHLQLVMNHCNPAIIVPSNPIDEQLAQVAEQNGWGHSVCLSSEKSSEKCLEFVKRIVSNRSTYQKNMKSMCKELELWNNGGMRGAYAINLTCKKSLTKLEKV